MDDDQQYMKFGMDEDYDGGQWINGEFYYSKKKERKQQTRDDALYGVFNESDSDQSEGKRRRKRKMAVKEDLTKPVSFVSKGNVLPSEEQQFKPEQESLKSAIGTSGVGLGFSGPASDEREDDEEEEMVLPTSFGKQLKERAEKRKKEQQEQQKLERLNASSKSSKATTSIGTFEKHTKGFGMKMLEKMGYSGGGLGKNQQGIAVPVEAKLRPKAMGMGFNDFKEREVGLPAAPGREMEEDENEGKGSQAVASSVQLKKPREKLWKKKNAGKKREFKTAEQLLQEKEEMGADIPTQKIIDMRGSQVRVLTSLEDVNSAKPVDELEDDTPLPELQHNLRLVVDQCEADIQILDRKLRMERESLLAVSKEAGRAKKAAVEQATRIEIMESVMQTLEGLQETCSANGISFAGLRGSVNDLKNRFPQEFKLYNIAYFVVSLAVPLGRVFFRSWDLLRDPFFGFTELSLWKSVLSQTNENAIFADVLESSRDPFSVLVREAVLPSLRSAIVNAWNPKEAESLLRFFEHWDKVVPRWAVNDLLEHFVYPKLNYFVDRWEPEKDTIPIHLWIHPWLPWMGEGLTPLFQPIRRKLEKILGNFRTSDRSAFLMLAPWQKVFDPKSWESLLKFIVPKLAESLSTEFVINPRSQDLATWQHVIEWAPILPPEHTVRLLELYFFPQFHNVLYRWLVSPGPNFEEVTRWYLGWKAMIPADLLANEAIRFQLSIALEMMNRAVEGAPLVQPGARENVAYLRVTEQQSFSNAGAPKQAAMDSGSASPLAPPAPPRGGRGEGDSEEMSLKETVAHFAELNNVTFLPKAGRFHEARQVYGFGAVLMCIDTVKQILLAYFEGRWAPASLEELLDMHRRKGGRWG